MNNFNITIREEVKDQDRENVRKILSSTGFFYEEEINIGVELVEEALSKGIKSGYYFLFAEIDNKTIGFTCYGPIPCTRFSYDIYWIALLNSYRGKNIGSKLLELTEKKIFSLGGKRIYIETSSRTQYESTREFYKKKGYKKEAIIENFYDENDSKVIFLKILK